MGSLALSLCHLAAGRLDAVCSLKPYRSVDVAAGQLLVRERGLAIANVDGDARSSTRRSTSSPRSRIAAAGTDDLCRQVISASIRIGCSGWNYAHWRNGVFYPPRLPASKWLDHYAQFFDTVEVNSTFYRLPRRASVARWVEQSPPDFVFAIKGSRYLTHIKRLNDLGPGARALLRVHRAAARLAEARADPLAAAAELQARRRAARERARAAAEGAAPRVRVPRRELVPRGRLRAAARAPRRARDRRPAGGARVPVARADDRLHVRALPLRHARRGAATTARRSSRSGRSAFERWPASTSTRTSTTTGRGSRRGTPCGYAADSARKERVEVPKNALLASRRLG